LATGCGATHAAGAGSGEPSATPTARKRRSCDRSDQDSTALFHSPLYRTCAVDVPARVVEQKLQPNFRWEARTFACYSALIIVAVDTTGMPEVETAHIQRYSNYEFAQSMLDVVGGFRFEPARLGDAHVRQLYEWHAALTVHKNDPTTSGMVHTMPGRAPC
jgi:hypothetical protein